MSASRSGGARSRLRGVLAAGLLLLVVAGLLWLFLRRPGSTAGTAFLILVIGLLVAAFVQVYVPDEVPARFKRTAVVGLGFMGLIAALLAIPSLRGAEEASDEDLRVPTLPAAESSTSPRMSTATPTASSTTPPLTATVVVGPTRVNYALCIPYHVPDAEPSTVPAGPDSEFSGVEAEIKAERAWVERTGAVTVGRTQVELRVQGTSETAVVLEGLHVVIDSSAATGEKDVYAYQEGCGGGFTPRIFGVDLDARTPRAEPKPGFDENGDEVPPVSFPFKVSTGDPETFIIGAYTERTDVKWHLEIPWYSAGDEGLLVIRPVDGIAFETLGSGKVRKNYYYDDGAWR